MVARRHAEIAGAGFAGLSAAIALCQRGWSVTVHEASPELRELGAGIFIWENGLKALDGLGVLDRVLSGAVAPPASEVRVEGNRKTIEVTNAADSFPMLTMTRQSLYAALLEGARGCGADIRTSSRVIGAEPDGVLVLESGERRTADFVLGADGVRSAVRGALGLAVERVRYPNGIIRVLTSRRGFTGGDWDNVIDFWTHRPVTRRILYVPCGPDTAYLALMAAPSDTEGSRVPVDVDLWSRAFPMLAPLIAEIGSNGRYTNYERTRVARWSSGRAAVVGDAAHAMPPTLGQGACVAMMNALGLAVALDEREDVVEALSHWERRERPFTDFTQQRAEELAAMGSERSDLSKRDVGLHARKYVPEWACHPKPTALERAPEHLCRTAWYRDAWDLVMRRHHGKRDPLGRPTEEHFVRVTNRLIEMFPYATPSQIQAALLHDALEPGGYTEEALVEGGVTPEALRIIRRITLPTDGRDYLQYARDLAASGDIAAVQVKLADNADAFDLFGTIGTPEAKRRIEEQYIPSRALMAEGLPPRLRAGFQ